MNELYIRLKSENNFLDAYLVIKNLLSKSLGNTNLFKEFIEISLEIAMFDIAFDERKQYIGEANSALALFSESADIDEDTLAIIKEARGKVNGVFVAICNAERYFYDEQEKEVRNLNTKLLDELAEKNRSLLGAPTQEKFDLLLEDVTVIESKIAKDFFSDAQRQTYETLTKSYSHTISSKMEELNRSSLLSFNKKAIACFKDVFDSFINNKAKYKDSESNLKALTTSKLFVFDTSKLFNESLIYYNHVYSMIFQEVNDGLKYKLTEWAIKTNKVEQ